MDSVDSVLVLLDEEDPILKQHALTNLHKLVDAHWAEISEALTKIEEISEISEEPALSQLAAAVASKCFYHLEEYDDALRLALAAGNHFDVGSVSEYSTTMVGKCIDTYITVRTEAAAAAAAATVDDEAKAIDAVDPRLESIVEGMFDQCYTHGTFRQALGIALEAQRLDKVTDTLVKSGAELPALLTHTLTICQQVVSSRSFRLHVLAVLVKQYNSLPSPNYEELAVCLHYLNDVPAFAALLLKLLNADQNNTYLMAYQLCFDLVEIQDQRFSNQLQVLLQERIPGAAAQAVAEGEAAEGATEAAPLSAEDKAFKEHLETALSILSGGTATALHLDFLYRRNKTDPLILKQLKQTTENNRKSSVLHTATIVAHAYMNSGTTNDSFLRNNLDWLARASNWAKFGATASIGVVHKGNVKPAMQLLQPYLPKDGGGASTSAYSEGGALYALGLIHAGEGVSNHAAGANALEYLKAALANAAAQEEESAREVMQHGACLGVGLVAMSSGNTELIEQLRHILYQDNAVAGEGAALAMGMVMLGGGMKEHAGELEHLMGYAHDTKHEKIIRGVALCAAMAMYGQEEAADVTIDQLCLDKDPVLRYGGMYAVAMAYAGTSNNAAIRRLLHVAVSDVNNDVRRAAVLSLGFLMLKTPDKLPELIALLSESYNPHVRYGAAMALGIGCSGMADPSAALQLLEVLTADKVDFVRQGAFLASAMLLLQQNPEQHSKAKAFRAKLSEITSDQKHSSTMTLMGSILSQGLLDAGGRNVGIDLMSHSGVCKAPAIVGMVLFTQYWFWYPMLHMLSLTFTPTALIGVNWQLDLPKDFKVNCGDADMAKFAYPKPLEEKKADKKVRVKVAELSTTAKAKAKNNAKKKKEEGDGMEVDEAEEDKEKKVGEVETVEDTKEEKEDPLQNPLRVVREQLPFIRFSTNSRYVPVYSGEGAGKAHRAGIVVLKDNTPDEPEDVLKVAVPPTGDEANEAKAPEPFEWTPPETTSMDEK